MNPLGVRNFPSYGARMTDHDALSSPFDLLDAYRTRLGHTAEVRPDGDTLRALHLAHIRTIPFENLDALGGTVPSLAAADLAAKLLGGRRGGYCYEHNTLFALALEAAGFEVTRLTARVVLGVERFASRPRTHMALLVRIPGEAEPYLADVGFGASTGLLQPLPLVTGFEAESAGRRHRLVHAPHPGPLDLWVLEAYDAGKEEWQAQYAFTVEPFEHADFEMVNFYIAASPRSPFSRRLYALRTAEDRHLVLDDRRLTVTAADGSATTRELADEAEARTVLAEDFGITAPDGMTLLKPRVPGASG